MKPLDTYRRCLIWLCVYPADESSTKRQKIAYAAFTVTIVTLQFCVFVGSLVFCWKFFSVDLKACMLAFMAISVIFGSIYMIIIGIRVIRDNILVLFEDLSNIYNNSEYCVCFMTK